ncbi:MAG: hypothetical protein WCI72_01695 [archaeon]
MSRLEEWNEVIFKDWPAIRITERTKEVMQYLSHYGRYLVDNTRIAMGRIYTGSEYEARRQKILSTPLP